MKNQKIILDNNGHGTDIIIPPGYKALKIIRFEASGDHSFEQSLGRIRMTTNLDDKPNLISLDQSLCKVENGGLIFPLNQNVPISKETSFKFRHMETLGYEGKLTLHYELLEIPEIPVSNPEDEFQAHLDNYDNAKIVFSAPFGSGKSYFLDYFFSKREAEYEVFKVYPVNYSVASNEDIFKYIKADLLFQLMGKDVDFDKEGITFYQAIHEYVYLNPFKTLSNFVEQVSKLHPKTELISKSVTALKTLLTPFVEKVKQYQASQEIDDKKRSLDFIQELYESEGSLYEDNIYTQIIRQLLERLKESYSKKSVLVIEDLDRMDPDHIFRILNVISAHYDTFKYGISEEEENSHNKFGFDKIIVVCDVKNIKAIFEHRYGEKADFAGYFNKFFCTTVFSYSNSESFKSILRKEFRFINPSAFSTEQQMDAIEFLLFSLIEGGQFSLRNYKRFLDIYNVRTKFTNDYKTGNVSKGLFTKPIFVCLQIMDFDELKKRILKIKTDKIDIADDAHYQNYSLTLMASLSIQGDDGRYYVYYNEVKHYLRPQNFNFFTFPELVQEDESIKSPLKLSRDDFYELLLLNLDKIKELKLGEY